MPWPDPSFARSSAILAWSTDGCQGWRLHSQRRGSRAIVAPVRQTLGLERLCLVDQHDRDAVPDLVLEPAALADQYRLLTSILQLRLALGTDEDFEQLWCDAHFGTFLCHGW